MTNVPATLREALERDHRADAADAGHGPDRARRHAQARLPHARRPRDRVGADPRRGRGPEQADPVHLVAGRLRDRLPLLRDRDARLRAPPGRGRDRRAGLPRDRAGRAGAPTNLVFMGMGEPLHNYDNVVARARAARAPVGRRVLAAPDHGVDGRPGARDREAGRAEARAQPRDLAQRDHRRGARRGSCRSTRSGRSRALLDAARRFPLSHGRRVTFEYVLLAGVNDSDADADRLPRLLRGIPAKVNLIPWNPFQGPDVPAPVRRAHPHVPGAPARGRGLRSTSGRRAATTSTPPAASCAARELVTLQSRPRA